MYCVEELPPRENASGLTSECASKRTPCRQLHTPAGRPRLTHRRADLSIATSSARTVSAPAALPGAPQHSPPRATTSLAKRLDDVVRRLSRSRPTIRSLSSPRAVSITIGTSVNRRSSRVTSSPSRSGRPRSRTTRAGLCPRLGKCLFCIGGRDDDKPGTLEMILHEAGDAGLVFDNEDVLHVHVHCSTQAGVGRQGVAPCRQRLCEESGRVDLSGAGAVSRPRGRAGASPRATVAHRSSPGRRRRAGSPLHRVRLVSGPRRRGG